VLSSYGCEAEFDDLSHNPHRAEHRQLGAGAHRRSATGVDGIGFASFALPQSLCDPAPPLPPWPPAAVPPAYRHHAIEADRADDIGQHER